MANFYNNKEKEATFQLYIADCLYFEGQGKAINLRLQDVYERMRKPVVEKSSDDIINEMVEKGGITIGRI